MKFIRAEMNGLDFDHRVLSPWTRDPSFYVTVFAEQSDQPAREAEWADAAVELWALKFPLSADAQRELLAPSTGALSAPSNSSGCAGRATGRPTSSARR